MVEATLLTSTSTPTPTEPRVHAIPGSLMPFDVGDEVTLAWSTRQGTTPVFEDTVVVTRDGDQCKILGHDDLFDRRHGGGIDPPQGRYVAIHTRGYGMSA